MDGDGDLDVLTGNIVTPSGSLQDTFLYLLVSNSAPIVRAQDKGGRIFCPPTLLWLFLARGRVGPGALAQSLYFFHL